MRVFILGWRYYLVAAISLIGFIAFNAYIAREAVKIELARLNQLDSALNPKNPLNYIDRDKNPQEFELVKEKAFLEAQIELSNSDSIALVIDLRDSLAVLQIKGVAIYTSKISNYSFSTLLNAISVPVYYNIFSKPLTVYQQISTIAKEPIVIKIAPKDTIEAAKAEVIPDSVVNQSTVLKLVINEDIQVVITNHEEEGSPLNRKLNWSYQFIKKLIAFKKVDYQPTIKLVIPNEDIVVIYRALPWNAKIAIKL
jgi:hypothetical protein